ncbi:MAG: CRTAC1 family protein [Rhodopirellula sp.]|nr:CRTAC1 family protein [Rhodopirellula sp.]
MLLGYRILYGSVAAFVLVSGSGCGSSPTETRIPVGRPSPAALPSRFVLRDVTQEAGVDVQHYLSISHEYHMPDIVGYGCAALDFDRDGDVDLLFACYEKRVAGNDDTDVTTETPDSGRRQTSASELVPSPSLPLVWPGTFFRQDEPGRFVKTSQPVTQHGNETPMGVAVGDVNNDGWPDIYMTCYGHDQLFVNRAGKGFENVTIKAGISNPRWGTSACFFDYDRDGWLDLYVTNYVDYFPQKCVQLSGVNPDFCGPQRFKPTRDCLFRNRTGESSDGAIRFADVSIDSGIGELAGKGLGVAAADFTGDGWQDIYVANDQEPNFLWVNQHDGSFSEEAVLLGCATDHLGNSQASMGVCLHDFDDNGILDIFVTHIDGERNTLYLGTSQGDFRDATLDTPACRQSLDETGFGVVTTDLDDDGRDEVIVANGRVRRPDDFIGVHNDFWAPYQQALIIHTPDGAFPMQDRRSLFRGLIAADLDGDGDRDLVLTSIDHPPTVFKTERSKARPASLLVRTIAPGEGSRDALGAAVTVRTDRRLTTRLIQTCGSYLSATMPIAEFSLSTGETVKEWTVVWPDGQRELFSTPINNRNVQLEQGRGAPIQ